MRPPHRKHHVAHHVAAYHGQEGCRGRPRDFVSWSSVDYGQSVLAAVRRDFVGKGSVNTKKTPSLLILLMVSMVLS